MPDSPADKQAIKSSVGTLMQHYFLVDTAQELAVAQPVTDTAAVTLSKQWSLATTTHHTTLTGSYRGNTFASHSECKNHLNACCRDIEAGNKTAYVQSLEQFVAADVSQATWQHKRDLGEHGTRFLYVHSCNQCGGQGENTCHGCQGRGRNTCNGCHGNGRINCTSCYGAGQTGSGQYRSTCGGCSGTGKVNCYGCFGSGRSQCHSCSGSGSLRCSPCDATGYFTERYRVTVEARGQLTMKYPGDLKDWQTGYIKQALENRVSWADLSSACHLTPASVLRSEPRYPLAFSVQGTLPFTEAGLSLRGGSAQGQFVGEACHVYQLDQLGDVLYRPLIDGLASPQALDEVRGALLSPASQQLLGHRHSPAETASSVLRQAGIIGQETVKRLFSGYHALTEHLVARRSMQSLGTWCLKGALYTVLALLLITLLDAAYGLQVAWEEGGLHPLIFAGLQLPVYVYYEARYIWFDGFMQTQGRGAMTVLGLYLLAWWLLLSTRKMTKLRFFAGLVITTVVLITLQAMFWPLTQVMLAQEPVTPGLDQLAAGLVHSLIMLPEALLFGSLIALLRMRRGKDLKLKTYAKAIESKPLLEDLGYAAGK